MPVLAALIATCALSAPTASAVAADPGNPIEGVWSFTGGAVGIQGLSSGNFQGTVVNPTKFATCEHPAGEVMWTSMRPQVDGSFWGLHQWFRGGDKCEANPLLGLTAWRVIVAADNSRHLLVCFSKPGDDSQPTIAPDGKVASATYGCSESSPLAPLPGAGQDKIAFANVIGVPSAKACMSRRTLRIVLRNPKYDPLKKVVVRVNGKKFADVSDPTLLRKSIRLKNLPEGTFKVSILASTVLNKQVSGSRIYRACVKGPGKIKVPGRGSHGRR